MLRALTKSRKHRGCFNSQGALEHQLTSGLYSFFLGWSSGVGFVVEWFVKYQCFQIENKGENIEFNFLRLCYYIMILLDYAFNCPFIKMSPTSLN